MNASKSAYENSLLNLAGSHHVETRAKIEQMQTDDKLQVAQTLTNEFGNQLLGASGIVSLQKLGKFANASKTDKAKQLAQAIGKKLKGKPKPQGEDEDGDVFEDAQEPVEQEIQRDPDFTNEEFETRDPEGDDSDFFAQMGGRAVARDSTQGIVQAEDGTARIGQGATSSVTDSSADSEIASASQASQGVGDETGTALTDTANAVTKTSEAGEGAEGALATLTGESAVADDNPIGIGLTAVLGVATLISGLFIHPSKPKVVQTAQKVLPNNFGVQAGLN